MNLDDMRALRLALEQMAFDLRQGERITRENRAFIVDLMRRAATMLESAQREEERRLDAVAEEKRGPPW